MTFIKNVVIIGSGYVGTTTAAVLANTGYKISVIDLDESRIGSLKKGKSFFYEEGIENLIKRAIDQKTLFPSTKYGKNVEQADIVISCVGTPDKPDGSSDLSYVFSAAQQASGLMKKDAIFVQKSTVPVGTGKRVSKLFNAEIQYVSSPEFLREGTAVSDTLFFDRIVAGSNNKGACSDVIELYKNIAKNQEALCEMSGIEIKSQQNQEYIETNLESAELIKVSANAFLALKISFANSMAKLADESGADVEDVMRAVGSDSRIGKAFFNAGRGYGGGCFPKDVSGLINSAREYGVEMPIMTAATRVNESMPGYIANKVETVLGSYSGKKVALLGLAFKKGTSDARRSPGVMIANMLSKLGADVTGYDPQAGEDAKDELRKEVQVAASVNEALESADVIFITTDWPEFVTMDLKQTAKTMRGSLVVDAMNCLDRDKVEKSGLKYIGVGR